MNLPRAIGEKYQEGQSSFGYTRRQKWSGPIAASATRLKTDQATAQANATTVTSFAAQPDFPRTITITPGGTTTDVAAGNITVTGKNIRNEDITELVAIAANASSAVETTKAFKSVSSVAFPAQDGDAATFSIGVGDKLGLDRCMQGNEVMLATVDGVYETTRPTVTFDNDEVEKNTIDTNTAYNGTKVVVAVYTSTERTSKRGSTT